MNRYFYLNPRVIVFRGGRSPGYSYWPKGAIGSPFWTLRDMQAHPVTKEISRRAARKIVKNIP